MVTTTDTFTATVADDGTIQLPPGLAEPGETIIFRITRHAGAESTQQANIEAPETDEPVRLTRLTAKTPEQKEELLRQIEEIVARLAPKLKDMPNHGDFLYGEDGLPR